MAPLSILSYSTVFPRPGDPRLGLFVKARLAEVARLAAVRVVAPVAWVEYGNHDGRIPGLVAARRTEGPLDVYHPRWLYPPGWKRSNPWWLWQATRRLVREIAHTGQCHILDAHFGFPEAIAVERLARELSMPFSVTLRGNEPQHASNPAIRQSMAYALRRASAVIAVSERLRQFALSLGVDELRTATIPNGIDPAVFYPRDRTRCRERFGMRDDSRHIVSAGYLIPRKGHHHIVRAVHALRRQGVPAELWIAGNPGREGDVSLELRRLAGDAPYVHFLPALPQTDLAELMSATDVFCLASSREGWPNVVHEALACGSPVVATDIGGIPDMIPAASFGSVVAVGDQAALEGALAGALAATWDRSAIAAWGARRTWAAVAAETAAKLTAACGHNG